MLFFSPSKRWTFLSRRSRSWSVRPRASPILMPARNKSRMRARSRVWWITERSFLTSLGAIALGSASGSLNLIVFFRAVPGMSSCSIRKWRNAMTKAMRVFTVEILSPRLLGRVYHRITFGHGYF